MVCLIHLTGPAVMTLMTPFPKITPPIKICNSALLPAPLHNMEGKAYVYLHVQS